jgi:hypothetical protein
MYIIVIAWIYVVLMMSVAERSIVAGVMTFLLYGILPLTIILYIIGAPERKRKREAAAKAQNLEKPSFEANPAQCRSDAASQK